MPQTSLHDQLKAALPDAADALQALIQPALRISAAPSDDAKIASGASKLGGQPDLPHGTAWPVYAGKPLAFVLQIRLADVSGYGAASALPKHGLLSFFYEGGDAVYGDKPGDRDGWRVLLSADGQPLTRTASPSAAPTAYKVCALSFAESESLPQEPALYQATPSLNAASQAKYEPWWIERQRATPGPDHQLFGYAAPIQDDMHTQVNALAHSLAGDDPKAAMGAFDWELLLQLDSDDRAAMHWGSAGMLYWWVEKAKLAAHDFSGVWLILQSD